MSAMESFNFSNFLRWIFTNPRFISLVNLKCIKSITEFSVLSFLFWFLQRLNAFYIFFFKHLDILYKPKVFLFSFPYSLKLLILFEIYLFLFYVVCLSAPSESISPNILIYYICTFVFSFSRKLQIQCLFGLSFRWPM